MASPACRPLPPRACPAGDAPSWPPWTPRPPRPAALGEPRDRHGEVAPEFTGGGFVEAGRGDRAAEAAKDVQFPICGEVEVSGRFERILVQLAVRRRARRGRQGGAAPQQGKAEEGLGFSDGIVRAAQHRRGAQGGFDETLQFGIIKACPPVGRRGGVPRQGEKIGAGFGRWVCLQRRRGHACARSCQ
jgi:hypothetical protein